MKWGILMLDTATAYIAIGMNSVQQCMQQRNNSPILFHGIFHKQSILVYVDRGGETRNYCTPLIHLPSKLKRYGLIAIL